MSLKIGGRFFRRTDVKLTLFYIFTFFVSALVICGFLYLRLKHQLIKEVDRLLLDEADELSEVLIQDPKGDPSLKNFEMGVVTRQYYPIYFKVLDRGGASLYVSKGFKEIDYGFSDIIMANAKKGEKTKEIVRSPGRRTPYRIINTPVYNRDGSLAYIIQLATHLRFVRKSLSHFKRNILAVFPIILALGSLGGWILARRSVSPIGYIASKTKTITSKNLSERLTPRGAGDEMDDLIGTINGMIARLESSFKRMAEFTADASHELKTPICAMRGEAEVLLLKERKGEEYQEGLAHFVEQFDRLNQLINDLILLSKSDTSQIELKKAPLRLDLLIQDLFHLFQVLAEQKNIALEIGILEEVTVMGDKVRLQQLFTNLIDNAIKYTPKGFIHVTVERNESAGLVKIKDTGIGIPKEEQEKIFRRFYRVDKSRSKETGGVGLGLSIAEWIVHAHRGKIEVKSQLNQGSTFTVYIPLQIPLQKITPPSHQN
jgi:heavy metal sensor kinase